MVPLGLPLKPFLSCEDLHGQFRKELGVQQNTFLVGIVGRLVPIKNHTLFLEAAGEIIRDSGKELSREISNECRFLLIGDGELRDALQQMVEGLNLVNVVHFLGWRRDLAGIYSDLDLIILTSLNEGTPVSLIEAMAAAKPVVATRVGGVEDLFTNQVARETLLRSAVWDRGRIEKLEHDYRVTIKDQGLLISSGDKKALVEALQFLRDNRDVAGFMGERGRERVRDHYTVDRLCADLENLYLDLHAQYIGEA